jgi:hypothetical protein
LLRLLELYVLWTLGELPEDADHLEAMARKLVETLGGDGTWQDALATTMHMPDNMPELVRDMWGKSQEVAAASSVELLPQQFAEMFVDGNLT